MSVAPSPVVQPRTVGRERVNTLLNSLHTNNSTRYTGNRLQKISLLCYLGIFHVLVHDGNEVIKSMFPKVDVHSPLYAQLKITKQHLPVQVLQPERKLDLSYE